MHIILLISLIALSYAANQEEKKDIEDVTGVKKDEITLLCDLPELKTIVERHDIIHKLKKEFSSITEVKFPGQIGPLNEKVTCKIKCIDKKWVGPLCSDRDGRFQPVLRTCIYKNDTDLLKNIAISFKNNSIEKDTNFPHGSEIKAICKPFGLYKLKGESTIHCQNGEWIPKFPECVPTTQLTNFSADSPPTIQKTLESGSGVENAVGELEVYPDTTISLDCLSLRAYGEPEWQWTHSLNHGTACAWSSAESEKHTHFRLTLNKISVRHTGRYVCTTPAGLTNSVAIKVVSVTCPPIEVHAKPMRQFAQGSRLGHSAHFSCDLGYHLKGTAQLTCMGDGQWSAPPPTCVETFCPVLGSLGPHLSVVEYNSSFGGRAVFQCAWGYRLVGAPGLECEQDGKWSGTIPHCMPIYCPEPMIPVHGRLFNKASAKDGKHPVGDLIIYACEDGFEVVGESSILCTENGFWSHPPPFCVPPSEIRKADTIYIENTTLIHVEE